MRPPDIKSQLKQKRNIYRDIRENMVGHSVYNIRYAHNNVTTRYSTPTPFISANRKIVQALRKLIRLFKYRITGCCSVVVVVAQLHYRGNSIGPLLTKPLYPQWFTLVRYLLVYYNRLVLECLPIILSITAWAAVTLMQNIIQYLRYTYSDRKFSAYGAHRNRQTINNIITYLLIIITNELGFIRKR